MLSRLPGGKLLVAVFFLVPLLLMAEPQEAKVHQKKINREKEKRDRAAEKEYEQAVKQHNKNQSKETKAMMKKSKKEAPKNTPVHSKSGTSRHNKKTCK